MRIPRIQLGMEVQRIGHVINAIAEAVEKLYHIRGDGRTIRVSFPGDVPSIEYIGRQSGSATASTSETSLCYLCKITGGDSTSYTVDIYADGKDEASTGSGTLQVANMHINESLATGTWVVGHPAIVTEIEGD